MAKKDYKVTLLAGVVGGFSAVGCGGESHGCRGLFEFDERWSHELYGGDGGSGVQ